METYRAPMTPAGISGLSNGEALDRIAQLVDISHDLPGDDGTAKALAWCDELETRELSPIESVTLNYYRANAWANRQNKRRGDRAAVWAWEQPELAQQILLLRRAMNTPAFAELEKGRQCQILTNLANSLDTAGRFVESLEYWSRALAIAPQFWMARGNRGKGLSHYARSLYDPGHREVFLLFAHQDLETATSPDPRDVQLGHPEAAAYFSSQKILIASEIDPVEVANSIVFDGHPMGRSAKERQYRDWCLHNNLFLNPLNDLGEHSIAARDILTLPSFATALDEPPVLIGFFNQLKQEFVSSRWEYYEGVHSTVVHFSDRGVLLRNTLDYPSYALAVERMKAGYRATYSLFDKIAFFLNHYMKLGIRPQQVSFRSVWREKNGDAIHPIRAQFGQSENWPLRGLFWLSKDFFDASFADVTEPDARALHELRIHLEHRYVKVHEMLIPTDSGSSPYKDLFVDDLAYSILRSDLQSKTLRLLKLARAALIYLSLGMHKEEQLRRKSRGKEFIATMPLDIFEDDWKR